MVFSADCFRNEFWATRNKFCCCSLFRTNTFIFSNKGKLSETFFSAYARYDFIFGIFKMYHCCLAVTKATSKTANGIVHF